MRQGLENVLKNPGTRSGNYRSEKKSDGQLFVYLFGNCIAKLSEDRATAKLTHCGWYTSTTTRALKGIIKFYNLDSDSIIWED